MVLKHLEIQGFKSFPDKTKVLFGQGLTAVVGPNGSGKSNISDAVRWVMGEQSTKNLRGSKMEDVIFTGTKTRKSQGFAEVSLVIDNSDRTLMIESDEVAITRKYYRSGESEYMINRSSVRLRDINELFMDTGLGKDGYAMVGQGRIAEIVQSKSDERREIFEEAAGISKYRYRKNEAEKKLSSAEENLLRLKDILQELEERVAPLKAQSEKAKRFLELADRRKTLEISSWFYTLEQSNQLLKDQTDKILARQLEHDEVGQQIESIETEIQQIYAQMQQCLVDIDQLRREKDEADKQVSQVHASIAVCENDILHNEQNRERIENEISGFSQTKDTTEQEILSKKNDLDDLEELLEQLEEEIVLREADILELNKKSEEFTGATAGLNQKINELLVKQSQNKLNLMQITAQKDEENERFLNNQELLKQKTNDLHQHQQELKIAEEFLTNLTEHSASLQNTLRGYQLKLERRQEDYEKIKQGFNQIDLQYKEKKQRAKLLSDLEHNLEGFAYSVKTVLNQGKRGTLTGIEGTVSQLLNVPEEYSTAVEVALGGSLQNIVVENEGNAKSAINFLKRENAGRATFLPMTAVRGSRLSTQGFEDTEGYVSLACDLVEYDEKYQGIVHSLLGRIVIVNDLDTAVVIARKNSYKFKIVTLDGQVVNAGGSMSGGSQNKNQGFLSRKADIVKLEQQAVQLEQQGRKIKAEALQTEQELSALRAQLNGVNSEVIAVNEDKIRCEGEQKRLNQQIEQETALVKTMGLELETYHDKLAGQQNRAEVLREELQEIETSLEENRSKLASLQDISTEYVENRTRLSEELSDCRYKKMETAKDMELLRGSISELERRGDDSGRQVERLREQVNSLATRSSEIEAQITALKASIEQNRQDAVSVEQKVQEKMEQRNSLESRATVLRQEEKQISVQKERLAQDLARFEERKQTIQKDYDVIISRLWEEYQLTRSEAQHFSVEVEDISELNKELNSVKAQIKGLGNVNVSAIEEYQEVSERYEFLNSQLLDVEKSRNELLRLIGDLTMKMREIFSENFDQINAHFKRVFVELFGGGRAELKLTDAEDILNCGIEIFVEPPGKIIKNLSLLSGGEQAFVAIAIYFAILKVRPAPFCILDEIEAALDDVNVNKYASYLRSMSDRTQFIMITHRRGTMEEADVLYGVTMQEEGVSKLLQLKVSEIEREMGEHLA